MRAIVYTSNTGFTKEYAEMLGKITDLPVYEINDAKKAIEKGSDIIYLGWLMAGSVRECKKVCKRYNVKAVCAVGLGETGKLTAQAKKANKIPDSAEAFTLQGGYAPDKLKGLYKSMMGVAVNAIMKQINSKDELTESDEKMLETLKEGGSYVCEENLSMILEWCKEAGITA